MNGSDLKKYTKTYAVIAAIILLTATFFAGVLVGGLQRPAIEKIIGVENKEASKPETVDFGLFWDVWAKVQKKFVDKEKLDNQKMVYGAISGLVRSLGDPHTVFLPPVESKQFQDDISGSFDGIGAEIGFRKGVLVIVAPLKNSPAEKAGLKAGDKIFKIDKTITVDLTLDEAVRLIRGKKGTEVILTILRDSLDEAKEIKITRDTIRIPIINFEKKENGIFLIQLFHFTENSVLEFRKALQAFFDSGSSKLILDLRNNPGGYLQIAVDITSWFLPAGEIVAKEHFSSGEEIVYRSRGYRLLEKVPTVLIVNEGSASASEIVAGALRDSKGVKLVGTKTFGKGSVQELEQLSGGASLKITIAKWLTPKGTSINDSGLEPDVKIEIPKDDKNQKEKGDKKDIFIEKAIEVLKGL